MLIGRGLKKKVCQLDQTSWKVLTLMFEKCEGALNRLWLGQIIGFRTNENVQCIQFNIN